MYMSVAGGLQKMIGFSKTCCSIRGGGGRERERESQGGREGVRVQVCGCVSGSTQEEHSRHMINFHLCRCTSLSKEELKEQYSCKIEICIHIF